MNAASKLSTLFFLTSASLYAGGSDALFSKTEDNGKEVTWSKDQGLHSQWGVAMAVRSSTVSFKAEEKSTSDVFPLFYYEGERLFLRGDHGGVKLWSNDKAGINAIARYRFLDVPKEYDEKFHGGTTDMGLQVYRKVDDNAQLQFEVLSDRSGRLYSQARWAGDYQSEKWRLFPELEVRFTGSKFNSRYYGLDAADLDRGLELRARLKARRQVHKNWHIEAKGEVGWLGAAATDSPIVEDRAAWEFYVGLGLFDEQVKEDNELKAKPYWRISQAWGTSSDLQNMVFGEHETVDGADVHSTSIFYGHPLSDTLFGAPIEMYLTSGVVYHHESDVQDSSFEFVMGVKGYYTFNTAWRTRLGIAEGISFADTVTFYEKEELKEKGHSESKLLNYIDVTLDVNVGDILKRDHLDELWLGTGIHHRSGIYGSSSAFGDVSGGTNFSSVYLQWHGQF